MTVYEFYIIRDGKVVPLPKKDFAAVAKSLGKRSKQQKRFGIPEALEIVIYPRDIKISPRGTMPKVKSYDDISARGKRRNTEARKDTETIPLFDLPRPLRDE